MLYGSLQGLSVRVKNYKYSWQYSEGEVRIKYSKTSKNSVDRATGETHKDTTKGLSGEIRIK